MSSEVISKVSFESEFRGLFRVAGRGVAQALDQGLDVSLQLLGEDHLLDALLHLVPTGSHGFGYGSPLNPFFGPPFSGSTGGGRWTVKEGTLE